MDKSAQRLATTIVGVGLVLLGPAVFRAWSQTGTTGTISVTVLDPAGASIPDASLELKDLATNDLRRAVTQQTGAYIFQNLPFGTYRLAITAKGFQSQVFDSVQVQTARVTDVKAMLKVGVTTETVEVEAGATPLVETDSSVLATTIDTKQVVNLPMQGRNVFNLAFLAPGFASTPLVVVSQTTLAYGTNGTFNNLPGGAIVGGNFDGVPGISNRFKSAGFSYGTTVVQPRIEDVAEMTVQTGQLDLSGGVGTSSLQINIVTRRGTNSFHGRLFEDFRNTALNANSWSNNALGLPRNVLKLNDFGGSVGGPIIKNKLFFFGTYAESIQPQSIVNNVSILSPGAQQGLFTYKNSGGALQTVNVLQIAGAAGYPSAILPNISNQMMKINTVLNLGTMTPTTDPNISNLNFQNPARNTIYYPTFRIDYNATDSIRISTSYSQTKNLCVPCNPPTFPGGIDPTDSSSVNPNNRIVSFGLDWVIRPTLVNIFHAGYTGQYSTFNPENQGIDLTNIYTQNWGYGTPLVTSGRLPVSSFYPLLSANDSVTWQKGAHAFTFGGTWWREQDHYWNSPSGYPRYSFGIASQDPVAAAFNSALAGVNTTALSNAEALYAELTGRISGVSTTRPLNPATKQYKPFGQYNLDESQQAAGFFAQDRWRLRSNLTLNYGLRWDIIGDDHDVNGDYTSPQMIADLWGPTAVGNIFKPGSLGGIQNPQFLAKVHPYKTSWVNPEPAVAIAWSPKINRGLLGKIVGNDRTVIRAGYSLRSYNEGQQNFWAFGSSSGAFFYQSDSLTANTSGAVGTFTPGSLTFGAALPPYAGFPTAWAPQLPESSQTFSTSQFWGMNPNLRSPYVEEWNLGIQRQIGSGSALEIRYVGNMAMHTWLSYNINEVNIFENGFLNEFRNAQANLAVNQANGKGNSFANNGLPGQVPLPILAAAFGSTAGSNYTTGSFITNLQTGAAGAMAQTITQNQGFICNMFGASFSPCALKGFTGAGAGYPFNFWQINPFATGRAVNFLDASGHSNYNGLQIEFRQRYTHGMQFNLNYTFAHSFGLLAQNAIQGQGSAIYFTDRNFRLNYAPSSFDIRHVVHVSGTYDLPFGKGKQYLNNGRLMKEVLGGWTVGTIMAFQTGMPTVLNGGFLTMNQNDPGVVFQNGFSVAQMQSSVGVYHGGSPWAYYFDPKYVASNGQANASYITPENIAGAYGYHPYIWGPHWFNADLSLNKTIPIREWVHMTFQAEFLNILNHPTFGPVINGTSAASVQSFGFGQTTGGPTGPRVIEFRANLEF